MSTPADDAPRHEILAYSLAEDLRMAAGIAAGPNGRVLRRAVDAEGRPLFAQADAGRRVVWVPVALVELIRAVRASTPAAPCPACPPDGSACRRCRGVRYLPADESVLANMLPPHGLPVLGDVSDVWGDW